MNGKDFKIGDIVSRIYNFNYKKRHGTIVNIIETISEYGDKKGSILHYIEIEYPDGTRIVDYYYCFEIDKMETRNKRIEQILNEEN